MRHAQMRVSCSEREECVWDMRTRVDTYPGRVPAVASRVGTSVADSQRVCALPHRREAGVDRYLIRLDMMWQRRCSCSQLCPFLRLPSPSPNLVGLLLSSTFSTVLTSSDARHSDGRRSRTRDISLSRFRTPGLSHIARCTSVNPQHLSPP